MGERARMLRHADLGFFEVGVTAAPRERDLFHWDATLRGPEGTPWHGRTLRLELAFPSDYPFRPPAVRFLGPMAHPNIYSDGSVCVDLLGAAWAPACDVRSVLLTLSVLLQQPNPNSPADVAAADAYRSRGMPGLAQLIEAREA